MKIEWNKKNQSLVIVYGIVAAVLLVLFLAVPFPKDGTSWIALIFAVLSLAVSCALTLYAFSSKKELTSKFYGFPIAKMGWIYAITQTVVSIIVIAVAAFVSVPSWIILILSILLLAITAIGVIGADNAREIIEETDSNTAKEIRSSRQFTADMSGISENCKDVELKKSIEKLKEKFRFSDPVSSPATLEIESTISDLIDSLRLEVNTKDRETVQNRILEIQNTLAERNRICKDNK